MVLYPRRRRRRRAHLPASGRRQARSVTLIGTGGLSGEDRNSRVAHGYDHVIDYRDQEDFVARVKRDSPAGRCVDVVYDSVGNDTFPEARWTACGRAASSSASATPRGPVDAVQPGNARRRRARSTPRARRSLQLHRHARGELEASCEGSLFDVVQSSKVRIKIRVNQTLSSLAEAAQRAHAISKASKTTGTTVAHSLGTR
jgi:NADPH2:quinone reductase